MKKKSRSNDFKQSLISVVDFVRLNLLGFDVSGLCEHEIPVDLPTYATSAHICYQRSLGYHTTWAPHGGMKFTTRAARSSSYSDETKYQIHLSHIDRVPQFFTYPMPDAF
jgi:hypothetical protein